MPPKTPRLAVGEKGSRSRSRSRSPGRKAKKINPAATPEALATLTPAPPAKKNVVVLNKKEERVRDNDILNLPSFDFQLMAILTVVAVGVRLFRIQQPTSVVFDEVQ